MGPLEVIIMVLLLCMLGVQIEMSFKQLAKAPIARHARVAGYVFAVTLYGFMGLGVCYLAVV